MYYITVHWPFHVSLLSIMTLCIQYFIAVTQHHRLRIELNLDKATFGFWSLPRRIRLQIMLVS